MAEVNNTQYASNSYKAKAEREKEVEKVVKGNTAVYKKSGWEKIKSSFGGGVDMESLITDVAIPALKDLASDLVVKGVNMILFGDAGPSRGRSGGRGSYIAYDSYSRPRTRDRDAARRARFDFSDIGFEDPTDIDEVIDELVEAWDEDREVSVAQFYTASGVRPSNTDYNWGWTNIRDITSARVYSRKVKEDDGTYVTKWFLSLPKPRPLNY